jgi:hypothetical protein
MTVRGRFDLAARERAVEVVRNDPRGGRVTYSMVGQWVDGSRLAARGLAVATALRITEGN